MPVLVYLIPAAIIGALAMAAIVSESAHSMFGLEFAQIVFGLMVGVFAGALWPATLICFAIYALARPSRVSSPVLCRLMGGHEWHTIGGITFEGKSGIYPNGSQSLWCMRCPAKTYVWPWGERKFADDETFGYSRQPASPHLFI